MSWTRRFIWVFWIFVITMLIWQAYQYNGKLSQPDPTRPENKHYFFYQQSAQQKANPPEAHPGPFVEQTKFTIEDNSPTTSSFTCYVTLKNNGKSKATNVQVRVRPYRGAIQGDVDVGHTSLAPLDDNAPLSQLGQWVSFPDLDPGESSTQNVIFLKQPAATVGKNPSPEIVYDGPEKSPAAPASTPSPSGLPPRVHEAP